MYLFCSIFRNGWLLGPPTCSQTGCFFRSSCHSGCTVLANREGWRVAGDLVPQEAPDNSWCWVFVYLYNVVKRTLKQELQVKETSGKRDRVEFDQHALLHHKAVLHHTLPPLPLHFLLIIILLLPRLLILLLFLLFKEAWKASWPLSSPAGTSSSPRSKLLTGFKLFTSCKIVTGITRLWFSDICNPDRIWRTHIKIKQQKN